MGEGDVMDLIEAALIQRDLEWINFIREEEGLFMARLEGFVKERYDGTSTSVGGNDGVGRTDSTEEKGS